MRVLFAGHVEHYTLGLSRELTKYIDLWILSPHRFNTLPSKQIVLPNIRKVRGLLRIFSLKVLPKLFDLIHANNSLDGLHAGTYHNLIVTEHTWPDPALRHKALRRHYIREREALLYLHEIGVPIITISNYCAQMLHKELGVKVHKVIYHGLLNEFRTNKPKELAKTNTPVILWVSRLVPIKEPMVLLEALKRLKELNFKVLMVGDGPLKENVKEFARKNELTSKIKLVSAVPFQMMPNLYKSATILVHTAAFESFGFSVLESLGAGLPVIVPRSGGAYEIAGPAAVSFIPHDPKDLSEKITSLLSDPDLYHKQSEKSLERSQFFTWRKAAKEYLNIYKEFS